MGLTVQQLADQLGLDLKGAGAGVLEGVNTLKAASPNELSFLNNPSYLQQLNDTHAGAVILGAEFVAACPVPALLAEDPYYAYAQAASLLYPPTEFPAGIHPAACIDPDADIDATACIEAGAVIARGADIGPACRVGANSYVGENSQLGSQTILEPNVSVMGNVHMGARCHIYPGAVIGADGFGFANHKGQWLRIPQIGGVTLGDDVEVGANTTIDSGAIEPTRVGNGVKLDNLIQVAHNVVIGDHTAIAGCTGIAGSAKIGSHCAIGGGVGIVGHITITDNVVITGMSFIAHDITEPGSYSSGVPQDVTPKWRRNYIRFHQLDDMAKRIKRLEKQMGPKK